MFRTVNFIYCVVFYYPYIIKKIDCIQLDVKIYLLFTALELDDLVDLLNFYD